MLTFTFIETETERFVEKRERYREYAEQKIELLRERGATDSRIKTERDIVYTLNLFVRPWKADVHVPLPPSDIGVEIAAFNRCTEGEE